MNRIAIVGHPSSGYMDVEALLKQYGMAEAAPSKREGMSVHDIQASLLKAQGATSTYQAQQETELQQLAPSEVWQGLALDLLLGNLHQQQVWGWASPETLPLLNMWHEVDAHTTFLLVYQHPAVALQQALAASEAVSIPTILNNWAAYHAALLSFYLRHTERSLLVHGQLLLERPEVVLPSLPGLTAPQGGATPATRKPGTLAHTLAQAGLTNPEQVESAASSVGLYLSQQALKHHPAMSIYEELQASATQPASSLGELAPGALLEHYHQQQATLLSSITSLQQKLEKQYHEHAALQREHDAYKQANQATQGPKLNELQQENSMLLEQLHVVQEELEKLHKKQAAAPVRKVEAPLYGAAERVKAQLTYRLGSVVVNSNSAKDFLYLPIALKREHKAFHQEKAARKDKKLPPISKYADAHKAEQVKQHLSYRLGQVIMDNTRTPLGWIKLPFALSKEAKAFKQERQR
ncbi:hypothetical protein [Vreelandella hamiltonii]|uniref:Chromosome partitioning protein ParA n=1 Tax=Halomonas johnsoniae TaxID=502832 RepID=A0ABQ2WDT9_9GAMM|nr:hypothetical protein [Halomonas johnsoniae]GGW50386.1 hypothetical protein GCM10007158_09160 [Halomonas johnsoniae]